MDIELGKEWDFFEVPAGFGQNVWAVDPTDHVKLSWSQTTGLGIAGPEGTWLEVELLDGSRCWEQIHGDTLDPRQLRAGGYDQGDFAGRITEGVEEFLKYVNQKG